MPHFVLKIIPIVFVFFLGFLLKRIKVFSISDGKLILNLVFLRNIASTYIPLSGKNDTYNYSFLPSFSIDHCCEHHIFSRFLDWQKIAFIQTYFWLFSCWLFDYEYWFYHAFCNCCFRARRFDFIYFF